MKPRRKLALALLLFATLAMPACGSGGAGSSGDKQGMEGSQAGSRLETTAEGTASKKTMDGMGGMSGMSGMNHGSTGAAFSMLMEDGRYSDRAFIDAMVPHHRGAVAMARTALENSEHQEIKTLAEEIVAAQRKEIRELKGIKKQEYGTSEVPAGMSSAQMSMMGMMDPQKLADQRPFDKAFIDAMVPHHRSAIEMAKVARRESNNQEIRILASGIVEAQKREISEMRRWQEEWYPEG